MKVDLQEDDNTDAEQLTDDTAKTEHDVTDAQQLDTAHGVAGTNQEQHGNEVSLWLVFDWIDCLRDYIQYCIGEIIRH